MRDLRRPRARMLGAARSRLLALVVVALAVTLGVEFSDAWAATGSVTVFSLPAGTNGGVGLAAGIDGNLWFTAAFPAFTLTTSIGVMTSSGATSATYSTGKHSDAPQIASGPDGNLWFSEQLSGSIGQITTAGVVTHFALPNSKAQPLGITAGPDGNVWFTEKQGRKIGRITRAGAVTEFPQAGLLATNPAGIAAGADGNLWFTEPHTTPGVGRITPAGAITEFPLPGASDPEGIAAGPDGNLWVTERGGNKIARVSPSGQITAYPLPRASSGPYEIAAGSDGNLWFTEAPPSTAVVPMVGRITPAGVITEYPQPSGAAQSVTAGPDGNIWFPLDQGQGQVQDIARASLVRPNVRYVLSLDAGFAPVSRSVALGGTVQWSFYGPRVHEVADSSGLGLFDSQPRPIVSFFSTRFTASGVYPYADPLNAGLAGKISVPVVATPTSGSTRTSFTITWASTPPATGQVFDVQIKRPGAASYTNWRPATTATTATFLPDAGPGGYSFRARLRNTTTGATSGYSQGLAIAVN